MVEILGNKLRINSIDIIPSNKNHSDEYLKINSEESSYELITNDNMKQLLNISNDKNVCINNGLRNLITIENNKIKFNVTEENPLEVTFTNQKKSVFTHINDIDYINDGNLFLNEQGEVYILANTIYHKQTDINDMSNDDIYYDTSLNPVKVYQYQDNDFVFFNDVYLGKIINQKFIFNGYNNNFTTQNIECYYYIDNTTLISPISEFTHNLNLEDISKYKGQVELICIQNNNGYEVGDIIYISASLSKNKIKCSNFTIQNKETNEPFTISNENWQLNYKIREL